MNDNADQVLATHQMANSILKHDVDHLQVIPELAIKLLRLSCKKFLCKRIISINSK
ncbi:hypothetical protein [Bathymodiolus platifrons methanotrophic gill symbiont]|uniref:hypothetical protein n=1 Tax=Bathymodiolus platifrons methanotrophic gill symbiont TaxID=113268 RepID=UPI00142D82BB|nr:hypothetical protein [Bathymodiolus platifrons methanotrophic gill symbiont]